MRLIKKESARAKSQMPCVVWRAWFRTEHLGPFFPALYYCGYHTKSCYLYDTLCLWLYQQKKSTRKKRIILLRLVVESTRSSVPEAAWLIVAQTLCQCFSPIIFKILWVNSTNKRRKKEGDRFIFPFHLLLFDMFVVMCVWGCVYTV